MGNILGFIIPIALAVTQPQLFGIAFKYLRQGAGTASKKAKLWNTVLKSIFVRFFWKLAMFAFAAELVLGYFISKMIDSVPWYGLALGVFLTGVQFAWAGFNLVAGARKVETVRINGEEITRSVPEYNAFWASFRKYAFPVAWLAATSFGFLAQGGLLEYYALTRVDDYGDQQVIILLAFLSKVMYGVMAIAVANLICWLIVNGTRFLERTSTIIAKMIVSIDLNIEYNKNALTEIGGAIDFLDEDLIASKIKYLFTVLFTPIIILDLAIFIWPSQLIAILILFGIVAVGLMEFVFGGMKPECKEEALSDRIKRMRIVFKLGPTVGMIVLTLAYGFQTITGRNIMVEVENFWYGINFIPYRGFWLPLFIGTPMLILAAWLLRKAWNASEAYVKARDAEPHEERGWTADVVRFFSIFLLFVWTGLGATAFLVAASAFASCAGGEQFSLSDNPMQEAVTFSNVKVNDTEVANINPKKAWPLAAPVDGQVYVEFDTKEKIHGVVEFIPPSAALAAGMDTYKSLNSEKREDGTYHHIADFDIPDKFSGKYRIVVRNATMSPQVNPRYGRVARTKAFDHTLPDPAFYDGWWGSIKAFWNDLWADDDNYKRPPPRTVIVRTETKPRPRGNSSPRRCTNNCKLTPLKVAPGFEDKVAAARNRR
jgi:hypothetical protein